MRTIARTVRALREARGLSLRELAARAGLSHVALMNLEAGDADPRFSTLKALAAALDVRLVDLVGGEHRPAQGRRPARRRARGAR